MKEEWNHQSWYQRTSNDRDYIAAGLKVTFTKIVKTDIQPVSYTGAGVR